jgi:hypothetical protein
LRFSYKQAAGNNAAFAQSMRRETSQSLTLDLYRNLVAQRTIIPAVQHNVSVGKIDGVFAFVTGIFAVDAAAKVNVDDVWGMWRNRPPGDVFRTCGRKWKEYTGN